MAKKTTYIFLISVPVLLFFLAFSQNVFASDQNVNYPWSETASPGEFVNNFYRFALGIAGAAAFGVIIFGAIIYTTSAGNPSKQQDARSWITGAVWGVVLLLAAYLILYTINPNLVDLTSPTLNKINLNTGVTSASASGASVGDNQELRNLLSDHGIGVKDGVMLNGLRSDTSNEIISLASKIGGSNVVITSGVEGAHTAGALSHSAGYKFDLRLNNTLHNYIVDNFKFTGLRTSDRAPQYTSPSGAVYARESDHWDVLVP